MSSILVENLSKRYVIGAQKRSDTLRDALTGGLRSLWTRLRRRRVEQLEFWALRDISFRVEPGEVMGIIGRNGAGKSTLLKVLSRITEPTTGRIAMNGRVASLLEVGTGFHPELTGRENIFLNGAILGMSRVEIRRKFDEIVAFSEVDKFLDTPVKRYSSGMYVRLAFAVAAHLEPEILIVDEVLAVGDALFQEKCLGKMNEVARGGRTVLFVSHNLSAIRTLCSTALLLDAGRVAGRGPSSQIISTYFGKDAPRTDHYERTAPPPPSGRPYIRSARLVTSSGGESHETDEPLLIECELEPGACPAPVIGLHFHDTEQHTVLHSSSQFAARGPESQAPARRWRMLIPAHALNVGEYRCTLSLGEHDVAVYEQLDFVFSFSITDTAFPAPGAPTAWSGYCSPKLAVWTRLA